MKVALLIDQYVNPHAGTEGQLLLLAQELQLRGHEVRLGVLRHTEFTEAGNFPAPIDCLEVSRIRHPGASLRLYRWGRRLRKRGFTIAQIFFNDAAVLGPWPLRLAGLKVITTRRDMGYWYTGSLLALLRLAAPAVRFLIANSEAAGEAACRREWMGRSKLRTIHNGVRPSAEPEGKECGVIPAAGPRVGIVANIRPVKRLPDLLNAFAVVSRALPDAELVIIGGGETGPLRDLASELGIERQVLFAGQVADPGPWLNTFTVGVLCSESEGLSNAILEYMRAGLPVVASNAGGNAEVVQHGVTGLLVPVGEVSTLASAILTILTDERLAKRMGSAGQERLEREFSVERMVEDHLAVYQAA